MLAYNFFVLYFFKYLVLLFYSDIMSFGKKLLEARKKGISQEVLANKIGNKGLQLVAMNVMR